MDIISYGNKETEKFDLDGKITLRCKWAKIKRIARRKLDILLFAKGIEDLKIPPNNKFEWLKGNLNGFASIRINNQWRIIFKINTKNQLEDVEIIDYHKG